MWFLWKNIVWQIYSSKIFITDLISSVSYYYIITSNKYNQTKNAGNRWKDGQQHVYNELKIQLYFFLFPTTFSIRPVPVPCAIHTMRQSEQLGLPILNNSEA